MTQAELSRRLGITQAALSNYELGKRRIYLHQIEKIARVFAKDLSFFFPESTQETDAPNAVAPDAPRRTAVARLAARLEGFDAENLKKISEYMDYLEWRGRHGTTE